jgi:sirohydrochlorin ferrochelatase
MLAAIVEPTPEETRFLGVRRPSSRALAGSTEHRVARVSERDTVEPGPTAEERGKVGIVVVDHGSRRGDANRWHEEFVRGLRDEEVYATVEPAHMELAEPSIATAFAACVAAGATTVVVVPYFLWPGTHWSEDIPALAAEAAKAHPGVRYLVAAPLGPHPGLGEIVEERITHCLAHAAGEAPQCEVCAGTAGCAFH